jgi:DNA-binding response OmpR family regulator
MSTRILLIEDDDRIRETTRLVLEDEGYDVSEAGDAEAGLDVFDEARPECVLLDLMLPGVDGFEACRELRRRGDVPIIMVTARTDKFDVVAGLEAGADDYVTKPFEPKELTARIRALLRRARAPRAGVGVGGPNEPTRIVLGDGDIEVIPEEGVVRRDGDEVSLTKTEFRLLCEMAASPGRVFSREVLLEQVWGYTYLGDGKLVDTHIHRLRAKIEDDPANPRHVVTVRGLGYKVVV